MDAELSAMQSVSEALSPLDDDERKRVIAWINSKYLGTGSTVGPALPAPVSSSGGIVASSAFGDFADLFHAVNPVDNAGRALVAAYWLASENDGEAFASQALNVLLKDIGYHVSNITDALSQCMKERPALIIQTRKNGSSKQARKLYKITDAGRRRLQALLPVVGA